MSERVSNEALKSLMLEKFANIDKKFESLEASHKTMRSELTQNNYDTQRLMRKVITGNGEKSIIQRLSKLEKYYIILAILLVIGILSISNQDIFSILKGVIL